MTRTVTVNRLEEASPDEIKKAIWSLKMNKASGPDEITARILRKAWPVVKTQLCKIMNGCLREARFPSLWKVADIVVIPKGKDKDPSCPISYRPISLISSMSKILESLIIRRLVEETKLDSELHQHGFTEGRSTITAMNELFDWADRECPNRHVLGVFLDITGAFDNMSWTAMLDDLTSMGGLNGYREAVAVVLTKWYCANYGGRMHQGKGNDQRLSTGVEVRTNTVEGCSKEDTSHTE